MKTKSADLYEKKTTCLDLELEQRDLLVHRSLEHESPLAEMLQKLESANFNVKKDVSNEDSHTLYTQAALSIRRSTQTSKVVNMTLIMLHCHRN